jgi:hypothetical protein
LVAVKVANRERPEASSYISDESYQHKEMIRNGMTYIRKFIKDGYFGECPYIMSEYCDYSIEEYIKLE